MRVYYNMNTYKLYKGFKLIGEYETILEAKNVELTEDGAYNLIGYNYRSSRPIVNGFDYGWD